MIASNDLLAAMVKGATHFYNAVVAKLNSGNYPDGDAERGYSSIQDAMSISPAAIEGNKAHIDIIIDLKDAPYAAAFEFGSGIHSTKGPAETYPIEPKDKKVLAFPWTPSSPAGVRASSKYADDFDGTFWLMHKVDHPGIPPKPYLVPTLDKEADKIVEIVGKDLDATIYRMVFGDTPTVETFVVKT